MKGPTPRRLQQFVWRHCRLAAYFARPGDGRQRPQILAAQLLWAQLVGQVLRVWSFHAIEALIHSTARRALGVTRQFGDDALAYFTERLDPAPTRQALVQVMRRAKRNKAFEDSRFIGLALDGTSAGRSEQAHCALCHPIRDATHHIIGHRHHLSLLSVVGVGLTLPLDIEPYGPGDSEYAASQRLLHRAVGQLGRRFADYVVADGAYATAPFLHAAGDLGLRIVARLKGNLPELASAVQARFGSMAPTMTGHVGQDRVDLWDADDFDPWTTLRWSTVRVVRYRQHKPNGTVVEADWLTDWPTRQVSALSLYRMAKARWEIENQGFNDAKTRYGMAHIRHHQANSVLVSWLLLALALTIERLYRQRYLHRGTHPVYPAIMLVRLLWLSLGAPHARHDPG